MIFTKKRTYKQHHNEKDSFYKFSAKKFPNQNKITESFSTDICIIGAGLTGISSALHLANNGLSITILEANKVGAGASGRNGGQLGIGMRKDQFFLEKKFGFERAKFFWNIGLEAVQTVTNLIDKFEINCALTQGIMHVGNNKRDYKYFIEEMNHMEKQYDYSNYEYFDKQKIKDEVASDRYHSGILSKDSYHLNPLKLTYGLAEECIKNNIKIFENSPVNKIEDKNSEVYIHTNNNIIKSKKIIVACNGYLDDLLGSARNYFMPINNYIIATEPLGENLAKKLIKRNCGVIDSRFMIDYYRFSEDYRLLFGGPETISSKFVKDAKKFVAKRMYKVFPEIQKYKIEFSWGGTLAISINRLPIFGYSMKQKLIYSHAYSGHGLAMSVMAGKLISEKILEKSNRFDMFNQIKHLKIPGGNILRRPIYSSAIIYYRAIDFFNRL
jgi:gamma-glutamylputrescine oxidase